MRLSVILTAFLGFLAAAPLAPAATKRTTAGTDAAPASTDGHRGSLAAAGLSASWASESSYGDETFWRFLPEVVGYGYVHLFEHLFLRPGVRIGYTNDQPQMPQSVRIEETDTMLSAELGAVYDWHIVPSFSVGYGQDSRSIKLKTSAPVDHTDDKISGSQNLSFWSARAGAGVPLVRGLILLEPFARYWSINQDDRIHWSFGIETTARLF